MRINKYLANSGLASRRKSEEYITGGKVKVNGKVVTNLATDIDENNDFVEVDGKPISIESEKVYLMFNKPKGCVCTTSDEFDRKTIFDYLPKLNVRIFSVGRLDYDTEGLLILTNDGDLANKLTHPSMEIEKTYIATVDGDVSVSELNILRNGVILDDGYKTKQAEVNKLDFVDSQARLEIKIKEGKNRQVRRMLLAIDKEIQFLKRTQVGEIRLGGLSRGKTRALNATELNYLRRIK